MALKWTKVFTENPKYKRKKSDDLDFIKTESIFSSNITIYKKMRLCLTDYKKIFAKHVSDKRCESKSHKRFLKVIQSLNNFYKENSLKNREKIRHVTKKDLDNSK